MDYAVEEVVRSQLEGNEKLLWGGQPRTGLKLRPTDAFLIPFSILWCGFAAFWELSVLKTPAPAFFALWGVPFVAIGLYLVFGRFLVDARARATTYYALTDRRAIIMSGIFARRVKSLPLDTISDITMTERPDGSGTITLGPVLVGANWFSGAGGAGLGRYQPPAFDMIENVRQVNDMLTKARTRT